MGRYKALLIVGICFSIFGLSLMIIMLNAGGGTWTAGTYVYFGFFVANLIVGCLLIIIYIILKVQEVAEVHSIECPMCHNLRVVYYIRQQGKNVILKVRCTTHRTVTLINLPIDTCDEWIDQAIKKLNYCAYCATQIQESIQPAHSGEWVIFRLTCPNRCQGKYNRKLIHRRFYPRIVNRNSSQTDINSSMDTSQAPNSLDIDSNLLQSPISEQTTRIEQSQQSTILSQDGPQNPNCDLCGGTGICSSCEGQGKVRGTETCDMCNGSGICFCRE